MALIVKDRVQEITTTVGTGTLTLGGAVLGFQTFAAIGDGNTTYYAIVDTLNSAWEVGIGTYTSSGTTLSRTAVFESSNSGSLVNFSAGTKNVFCTYPAERAVYLDAAGSAVTLLDIGTLGVSTANITTANITSGTVSTAPTNNTDIVNKQYADAIASGIHFHEAVELATTAALPANTYNNGTSGVGATLTANANGALSVDSTLTVVANRVLVKNEATQANNGVYTVTQVGTAGTPYILTRATDFDTAGSGVDQIDEGDFFLVTGGTANANTAWVQQTPPPITVGTTAIVFQQFSAPITYTAGTGLSESPAFTFNIANTTVSAATYGSAAIVPVFAVNAQGQLTSVTNTNIAINGSAVTGAITGQAGSVANALTAGTYLTSAGTYDGSAARTFAVDATSANTVSKVVARDASGNFAAGTITATLSGNATNVSGTVAIANGGSGQTTAQLAMNAFAGAVTSGQYLRGNGTNVLMSTIQAADVPTLNQNTTGSAATLTTGRTIAITGDLAYTSPSFNGSGSVTAAGTLATVNANVGSFTNASVTVNAKGLVTAVSNGIAGGTVTSVAATVPAFLSITGSPVTTSGTLAIGLSGTALPIANGGTAATSASAARTSLGLAIGTDVLAPNGSAASLTSFPTLNQNTTGSAATVTGNATGSTFGFNSGYGSVATAYGCRAWVNFDGTGTVAIRGSGNVSSITDNGTGDYTVNFTTAMPDANYGVAAICTTTTSGGGYLGAGIRATGTGTGGASNMTTTSARIFTKTTNLIDPDVVCVSIFR
jgi:hypothetical protein